MNAPPATRPLQGPGAGLEGGFSLVEIMVALVAGLLLAAAIGQVFLSTKQTYRVQDQLSRLQENGRFAMAMLAYDARMAGSLGCLSRTGIIENTLADPAGLYFNFAEPLGGFEAVGTGPGETYSISGSFPSPSGSTAWSPVLPAGITPDIAGTVIPGTDVLVLRGRVGSAALLLAATPTLLSVPVGAGSVRAGACSDGSDKVNGLCGGDLAMVADCSVTRIFQATRVTAAGDIGHVAGTGAEPGNACGAWNSAAPCRAYAFPTLATPGQGAPAEVSKLATIVYFISRRTPDADDPNPGPSLYRRVVDEDTGNAAANQRQEIVEGVDSMQILYGVDAGGGNIRFLTAPGVTAVAGWAAVTSIRVGLLMRTPDEVSATPDAVVQTVNGTRIDPYDDRRLRRVITTTIGLRNRFK